jgi:hypothetical protein
MSGNILTQEIPLSRLFEWRACGLLLPRFMEQTNTGERIKQSSEEVDKAREIWEATGFPVWGDVEQWLQARAECLPQKGMWKQARQGPSPLNRRG